MNSTILGIFQDRSEVERAINVLHQEGFDPKDLSIVMKDKKEAEDIGEDTGANVGKGAVSGATTGIVIGGIAGLLAGTILPGLGAFLIGGPIAAALGLGGAAATTVSGAATGAVAGGLIGALMGFGLTHEEAKHYESKVREGAILLAVPANDEKIDHVTQVFQDNHATDIRTIAEPTEGIHEHSTPHHYADRQHHEDHPQHVEHAQQYASAGVKGGATGHQQQSQGTIVNPIQVQKFLKSVDYPCSKDDLIKAAEDEGADQNIIHTLEEMPDDSFNSPNDVSRSIGRIE